MRVAALQLTSSDDPAENVERVRKLVAEAADEGADAVFTPEVTNCVSLSRAHQKAVLRTEAEDPVLREALALARAHGIWIALGSLAVKTKGERFANRSFVIAPGGEIVARYDKIHMFDVNISTTESFRESGAFAPGDRAVAVDFAGARLGLTICYDLRFAALFRALAGAGAEVIAVPAAFSPETGRAHWEVLLRARAIETGSFVIAAAQTGEHAAGQGRRRRTWGHSMIVGPWGEIIARREAGEGVLVADLDLTEVRAARRRVPSLSHDRDFRAPT